LFDAFMIALGTIFTKVIRPRLVALHRTTVAISPFFFAVILCLFKSTANRLFLVFHAVVAIAVALTVSGLRLDRRMEAS